MRTKAARELLFALVVAGFLGYAWLYVLATSFVIDGTRYYVLFDDAMVSMRYAYNLAQGNGLVWNIGERVQGFTNPLWVLYMALLHRLPLAASDVALAVQVSGALLLAGTLFFVRRIVEHLTSNLLPMLAAVTFTAFYAPLNSYGLLGMEVSALALLLCASIWLILRNGEARFSPWLHVLLVIGTLIRTDMAVPYAIIVGAMCFIQRQHRARHLTWGLGLLALSLGGQAAASLLYYGDWLPNTYYLKMEGWPPVLRILRGLYALVWFIYYSNWVLFFLPFALLVFRRDWKVTLPLAVVLGQLAYSSYVGGDAWEHHGGANRFICIAMPLFFSLLAASAETLRGRAVSAIDGKRAVDVGSRLVWAAAFLIALLNFNLLMGDWKSIERWNLARRPDYVAGSDANLSAALALREVITQRASVAVVGAGTIPYLLPENRVFDILGKTDPVIAREGVRTPMSIEDIPDMRPGHMKWDYARTLGELKPDVVVSIWPGTDDEAAPYLEHYLHTTIAPGVRVYLLKDSPNVLWDRVTTPG